MDCRYYCVMRDGAYRPAPQSRDLQYANQMETKAKFKAFGSEVVGSTRGQFKATML
jgi:hypothetical protein